MFNIERNGDTTILTVWQHLDLGAQPAFAQVLHDIAQSAARRLIVSLEYCAYCDSTAIDVLLGSAARLGSRLTVVVPPDSISRRVFEACCIGQLMHVVASMREALDERPLYAVR